MCMSALNFAVLGGNLILGLESVKIPGILPGNCLGVDNTLSFFHFSFI